MDVFLIFSGTLSDSALLDTYIHDLGSVVRQRQITVCLKKQKGYDQDDIAC